MGIETTTAVTTDVKQKAQAALKELGAKYEAGKANLEASKKVKSYYSNIYQEASSKYGKTDPSKVQYAKYQASKATDEYTFNDSQDTYLNREYFSAILRTGRIMG